MGEITYPLEVADEDTMMEAAIEAGADDVTTDQPNDDDFSSAELEKKFGEAKSVNLIWKAQNLIDDPEQAQKVVRMIDALEDCDDVTNVYHSYDMTEEAMATLEDEG